jgi:hypothetical protein
MTQEITMADELKEHLGWLFDRIASEGDPQKLAGLVVTINEVLDAIERRMAELGDAGE